MKNKSPGNGKSRRNTKTSRLETGDDGKIHEQETLGGYYIVQHPSFSFH